MSKEASYVIYARKSTDREDKQMLSIPGQLHELRELAKRNGLKIRSELTEACSARDPGRPVFSNLLQDIMAGRVDRILSWKLDRLARNPVDGGALIHALGKGALAEIRTPEGSYTGNGDSKFMLAVHFGVATKMVDDLSAGVRRGSHDVCRQGRIPGAPPLGYVKTRERSGFRGAGKAMPDPERFQLVQRLWLDVASGGLTITEAWRRAVGAGLTSRPTPGRTTTPIKLTHVYCILKNRFYTGLIDYDGEIYQGEHTPMVTSEQFEAVQARFGRVDVPRPSRHEFLFRGLIRCGACGGERLMVGEEHTTTAGNRLVYYRCGRRRPAYPVCRSKSIPEPTLAMAADTGLASLAIAPELARWTMSAIDWWIENHKGEDAARTQALRRQIHEEEAKLTRITDLLVTGTLDEEQYRTRKQAIQVALHDLRQREESPSRDHDEWRAKVQELLETGISCADIANCDPDTRRALLTRVYANFQVTNGIPHFTLRFPYLLLKDAPVVHASLPGAYANLPEPKYCWTYSKKAARHEGLIAAFSRWCTLRDEVLTAVWENLEGLFGIGSSVQELANLLAF